MKHIGLIALFIIVTFSSGVYAGEMEDRKKAGELKVKFEEKIKEISVLKDKYLDKYSQLDSDGKSASILVRDASWAFRKFLKKPWADEVWIRDVEFYFEWFVVTSENLVEFYEGAIKRFQKPKAPKGEIRIVGVLEDK